MHPAEKYAEDVVNGKIITCSYVKQACERYFRDLETGIDKGFYFDRKAATKYVKFFELLKLWEGKWANQPFKPEPWMQFIIWNIFGFKESKFGDKSKNPRRFNTAYIEVARKNAKTTFASAVGLEMMTIDREEGAQIYSAATKQPQAKIALDIARNLVRQSPALSKHLTVYQHNIHSEASFSKFEALSSDSRKQDGLNPHMGLIDEFHAWDNEGLYNVIESGMGSRTQPLMFIITTAGYNKIGPCYRMRGNIIRILEGIIEQEDTFGIIYTLDNDEEWKDENMWIKSNPSMEAIDTTKDFIRKRVKKAENDNLLLVDVLTKNFNVWTDASEIWIRDRDWMACADQTKLEELAGMTCYGGIDLSSESDITSLCLYFPDTGDYLWWMWCPAQTAADRETYENVNYRAWINGGHLIKTEGNSVDYNAMRRVVTGYYIDGRTVMYEEGCLAEKFNIIRIGYDRFNSSQLVNDFMADGMTMSKFSMAIGNMNSPTKQFRKDVLDKEVKHGGNPVMRWMVSNVELRKDVNGNVSPDRDKSSDKIDGVMSAIIARGEALTDAAQEINYDVRVI